MAIQKAFSREEVKAEVGRLVRLHPREALGEIVSEYIEENFVPRLERKMSEKMLSPDDVQRIVCDHFRTSIEIIYTRSRVRDVLYPRQMVQFFLYRHTRLPVVEIGRRFGAHHTSILSSINRIMSLCERDAKVKEDFNRIEFLCLEEKKKI